MWIGDSSYISHSIFSDASDDPKMVLIEVACEFSEVSFLPDWNGICSSCQSQNSIFDRSRRWIQDNAFGSYINDNNGQKLQIRVCRNAICRQKEVRDCTSSHAKRIYEPECKINAIFRVDKLEENIKATNPFDWVIWFLAHNLSTERYQLEI